jgi:hypothetical protein
VVFMTWDTKEWVIPLKKGSRWLLLSHKAEPIPSNPNMMLKVSRDGSYSSRNGGHVRPHADSPKARA